MRFLIAFLIWQALSSQSAILRNPKTDNCLDGRGNGTLQRKCEAGSPHQSWIQKKVYNMYSFQVRLEGSEKCLATMDNYSYRHIQGSRVDMQNCSLTPYQTKTMKESEMEEYIQSMHWYDDYSEKHKIRKSYQKKGDPPECLALFADGTIKIQQCGKYTKRTNNSQDIYYE
jgi:hypothetical protein